MATTVTYNTARNTPAYVYRATSGGTVFSSNLSGSTAFDYFTDSPAVNDAIYFSAAYGFRPFSDIYLQVGTALVGTDVVLAWETYTQSGSWVALHNLTDGSNGFTTTGDVRVRFPIQAGMNRITVNSISNYLWVRCRIVSFTTITEGGANATTAAKVSDGAATVTGSTDESPASFTDIYNYLNTNAPETLAARDSGIYYFPCCRLVISSRLVSTNQVIFLGCGAFNTICDFSYLTSGTKVGTSGFSSASHFFFTLYADGGILASSTNTKMYGATIGVVDRTINSTYISTGGQYIGMSAGEWIGCTFLAYTGYFSTNTTASFCNFMGNVVLTTLDGFPTNSRIFRGTPHLLQIYSNGGTISNLSYDMPSTSFLWRTNFSNPINIYINNPSPAMPDQTSVPRFLNRTMGTSAALTKCFYYNSGATSYTDYTTESASATVDDVPLPNSAGDILYLNKLSYGYTPRLDFTITPQTNTATYAWEYYTGSTWAAFPTLHDFTSNLTTSGKVYLGGANPASTTVNSVSGYWCRIRCVTPSSGSPTVTKIFLSNQTGIDTSKYYERYSADLTVTGSGSPINGANVIFTDSDGSSQTASSDSSGVVPTTWISRRYAYFDPNASDSYYNCSIHDLSPTTYEIVKYGFQRYSSTQTFTSKLVSRVQLAEDDFIVLSEANAGLLTGIDIDGETGTITLTESHTLSEIYDYSKYWEAQIGNIEYSSPFTTSDGVNFNLTYDLTLDGGNITGTGNISMPSNTFTRTGSETSTVNITHDAGTFTAINLAGLVSGTRVQIYNIDDDVEVYNDTTGTSLFLNTTWTTDKSLRVRAMYCTGTTAPIFVEFTDTLTSTGFSRTIDFETDAVYAANGIDGSTVTGITFDDTNLLIEISGGTVVDGVIYVDIKNIYAYETYWLSTSAGIIDEGREITAQDVANYTFYNIKIKNVSSPSLPVVITGGYAKDSVTGKSVDLIDFTGGVICFAPDHVVGVSPSEMWGDTTRYAPGTKGGDLATIRHAMHRL